MVAIKSINTLTDYYKTRNEEERLLSKSGAVEFIVTTAYINKYLKRGDHILEVGCGTGQYTLFYARKGYTIDAVELVESNLNSVQRLHYIGTDMFTQYFPEQIESMDDGMYQRYLDYTFTVCENPNLVGLSNHTLDVLKKVSDR